MTDVRNKPGDLPLPTQALNRHKPIIAELTGPFFRIYRAVQKSPIFFGKTLDYRFDSVAWACGVLYASPQLEGAFVETFMQELGRTSVSIPELRDRPVAKIYTNRPLRFIDLCAKGGQMRLGPDSMGESAQAPTLLRRRGRMHCEYIPHNRTGSCSLPGTI